MTAPEPPLPEPPLSEPPLPDAGSLRACLAARGIAVPEDELAPVLAGARRLAEAAERLRREEAPGARPPD